ADEEDARAADERPDGEEVHVDAAGGVVRGQVVLPQDELQRQTVEVRLVRPQENEGTVTSQLGDLADRRRVVVDGAVPLADHPVDQVGDQVDQERAVGGGDLRQVVTGPGEGAAGRQPSAGTQL